MPQGMSGTGIMGLNIFKAKSRLLRVAKRQLKLLNFNALLLYLTLAASPIIHCFSALLESSSPSLQLEITMVRVFFTALT